MPDAERGDLSAEGRRILSLLDTGMADLPETEGDRLFSREGAGRPFFTDLHADFSISHSRNMAAAALLPSHGGKICRIGCDIQYIDPAKSCVGLGRRFFHKSEQAYIEKADESQVRNFYRIWVLKEAWIKLHGYSVFEIAKAPVFKIGTPPAKNDNNELLYHLYELGESYMLAIVRQRLHSADEGAEPVFRWFSGSKLTLNRVENINAEQIPENTVTPKI